MLAELSPPKTSLRGDLPAADTALRGKHAAVLVYSTYPTDPRVHRATQALVDAGMQVDVLCITGSSKAPRHENVNGAEVTRVPIEHRRERAMAYFINYSRFLLTAFWFLARKSLSKRYALVHVHNMPDILVFSALVPKLRGARVILDLHDPMPELMISIYGLTQGSMPVRLLRLFERISISFADLAITPNLAFKQLFVSRSCVAKKMCIVMNTPEEALFPLEASGATCSSRSPEFRLMHHGSIVHRHGVDLLIQALSELRGVIPGIRLDIFGSHTPFLDAVLRLADDLGVADIVQYHGAKKMAEIATAIRRADLGIVPNRRSDFTDLNFPTRIFEYIALGCPVIAPNTKGIRDYFADDQLFMFEPGNVSDLVEKIRQVWLAPQAARQVVEAGQQVYRAHLWHQEKNAYLTAVRALAVDTAAVR